MRYNNVVKKDVFMMKEIVVDTITNLEKIKEAKIDEANEFSKVVNDEVILTIDNMIAVLKYEYSKQK